MVSSKLIFRGSIIQLRLNRVKARNGRTYTREVVEHPGAAVILPVTADGKILLVRQYRHAIRKMTWELPAGTLNRGETPLVCAKRELEEETGWCAKRWGKLIEFYPTPGIMNERMTIFLAGGLFRGRTQFDEDEEIRTQAVSLREALNWIKLKKVQDAKSLVGLLMYQAGVRLAP